MSKAPTKPMVPVMPPTTIAGTYRSFDPKGMPGKYVFIIQRGEELIVVNAKNHAERSEGSYSKGLVDAFGMLGTAMPDGSIKFQNGYTWKRAQSIEKFDWTPGTTAGIVIAAIILLCLISFGLAYIKRKNPAYARPY
jgi:hypothetical protein